jgi:uncharacterized protein YbjT (DUF2867 family)
MAKLLTVIGATGVQGGSVIRAVLADPVLSKSFQIRAITRDVTKAPAQALAQKGIEVVAVSAFLHHRQNTGIDEVILS